VTQAVSQALLQFGRTGARGADRGEVVRFLGYAAARSRLAGARVGVVVAIPAIIDTLRVVQLTYGVGTPAQALVGEALADPARMWSAVARVRHDRDALSDQLIDLPIVRRVYPSEANFLLVELRDHSTGVAALRSASIAVADTSCDVPDTIRISVGTPISNDRLVVVLRDT
jgi:histidinol-phosphate aminotransferase